MEEWRARQGPAVNGGMAGPTCGPKRTSVLALGQRQYRHLHIRGACVSYDTFRLSFRLASAPLGRLRGACRRPPGWALLSLSDALCKARLERAPAGAEGPRRSLAGHRAACLPFRVDPSRPGTTLDAVDPTSLPPSLSPSLPPFLFIFFFFARQGLKADLPPQKLHRGMRPASPFTL